MDRPNLYDEDVVAWAEQQAAALRSLAQQPGLTNTIDWENVAEEIESLGRSQVHAVQRLLTQVMVHLLKRVSAPESPALRHWRSEIITFQASAVAHFGWSMQQRLDLDAMWARAIEMADAALIAYGDALLPNVPRKCPLQLEDLVAEPFDADAVLHRIAGSLNRPNPDE